MALMGVLVLAPAAHAQDTDPTDGIELGEVEDVEQLSLEDLLDQPVTAASGFATKPTESPTLVSSIGHDEIERFNYRTVGDAMRGMRGFYVNSDRNYSYVGSRGIGVPGDYGTRYGVTIADHSINEPIYGAAGVGPDLGLPMIAIERLDVVRGGAFLAHGENALLGALQITTATGATRPGVHVTSTTRASAESFHDPADRPTNEWRGEDIQASYGTVKQGVDVFVAGQYQFDPGMSAIYYPGLAEASEGPCFDQLHRETVCNGVTHASDRQEATGAYLSVSKSNVTVHAMASSSLKSVPTGSFYTNVGDTTRTVDNRLWADAQYSKSTTHLDVIARAAATYYNYKGFYPNPDHYNDDHGVSRVFDGEVHGRYRIGDVGEHLTDVEASLGAEASDARGHQYATDVYPDSRDRYLDRTDPARVLSIFGHVAGRAFGRFVGFASVRGDYHVDSFGLAVDPQVGLLADAGRVGRLRATLSRGTRAPTMYERFYSAASEGSGASLQPEKSHTSEISLEHYIGEHVRFLAVGFDQDVDDILALTSTDDGDGTYTNQGGLHSYGLEAEVEGRWDSLRWRSSYSRTHTRDNNGDKVSNSPESLASLLLMVPVAQGRAEVGVQSLYVAERQSWNGTLLDPLFTTNFILTVHHVADSLDLSVGINNVFDEHGGDPASEEFRQTSIPHDPRIVWIRLGVGLGE
jgi:iron complex outermembrane receptor protein